MASRPSVAIRLGTTGKAQVKADFVEIGDAGDATARRWSRAFDQAGKDAEAALARQQQAASKLAMITPQTNTQRIYQAGASTNYGRAEGSAKASAAVFQEVAAQEAALQARTSALIAAIDPAFAAQQRMNVGLTEARELYEADAISAARYTEAVRVLTGAREADAAMSQRGAGAAAASASVFEQHFASMEARARALVAAIDPAFAAQQRFDNEMRNARELVGAGAISLDEYCDKLRIERSLLEESNAALRRNGVSTGQLRAGSQQLAYQIGDVSQQFAVGTPILTIFAQQAGQTVQAIGLMTNSTKGFIGFIAGPWGAVLTGGVIILASLISHQLSAANSADEMAKHQEALANVIDRTTGRIKDQNAALVQNAILTARKDAQDAARALNAARQSFVSYGSTIPGVAELQRDYAAGKINAATASARLAKLTGSDFDPSGAYGQQVAVIQGQLAAITNSNRNLMSAQAQNRLLNGAGKPGDQKIAFGDFSQDVSHNTQLLDAQAKLQAATTRTERAQANLTITRENAKKALDDGSISEAEYTRRVAAAEAEVNAAQQKTDRHTQSLQRQANAMVVNADASLDLARAYLTGSDAAIKAEAARKGLTDATRKGIDGEAQVRRQLDVMVGEQVANGAKSVAQLRDEVSARRAVNDNVTAGKLAVADMNRALSDEAALRPLLKLQTVAQGDALQLLTQVIDAYRKSLADAHAEEARGDALAATDAIRQRIGDLRASAALAGNSEAQALEMARRQAEREADTKKYSGEERADFLAAAAGEAQAQIDSQRAERAAQIRNDQADSLEIAQRELLLVRSDGVLRDQQLNKLRLILDLKRQGIVEGSKEYTQILSDQDALDAVNELLREQQGLWDEIRNTGDDIIDTLLNPDNWNDFGDLGKKVLKELRDEAIKLALINPLKNWLFGENNPTIGGVIASIFGGSSSDSGSGVSNNAVGTDYAPGGTALVGEHGPELMELPRGTRITSAGETRRMMEGVSGVRISMPVTINAPGADAAALARVEGKLDELQQSLPGTIVTVVNDASSRRMLRTG